MVLLVFSKWKILSAYVVFSTLVLSGWYIDVMGLFSSQENYAGTFRAQHGDIGIYDVLAFFIGTVFYILLMLYDYMRMKLDKLQLEGGNIRNAALIGDSSQSVSQNSQNSPALTNSPGATFNYNINGVTEERCRAIFDEKMLIAMRDFSFESIDKAEKRTSEFRTKLITRMGAEENGYEAFADPSFQFLLMDAQRAAATTDKESDYQILSELLARRSKVGDDRRSKIHVKKAIEIIPYIPDDALLGLTITFALSKLMPVTGNIHDGIEVFDNIYGSIVGEQQLPTGNLWIESLETCGLVKTGLSGITTMLPAKELLSRKVMGYVLPGIKKGSKAHKEAFDLLNNVKLPQDILVTHEFNEEYVRLNIPSKQQIDEMLWESELQNGIRVKVYINEAQKKTLHEIYGMYEQTAEIKKDFENRFELELNKYKYIKIVSDWWSTIKTPFEPTATGRIIGNANANKSNPQVPMLEI